MDGSHGPRCETEAECYALNMPSRKIHFTAFVADLKINRFIEGAGLRPSYMWFIQPAEIEYDLQSDLNEAELIAFFRRFMNTSKATSRGASSPSSLQKVKASLDVVCFPVAHRRGHGRPA
mgnify:CR=1 FL=1